MRITLTGRRFAVAAVLVLGGVGAPLAFATIADGNTPPASSVVPTPSAVNSPSSAQTGTAVADSPYQFVYRKSTTLLRDCGALSLPAGQHFALNAVTIVPLVGRPTTASIGPTVNFPAGGSGGGPSVSIPLGSEGGGTLAFELVVRPGSSAANDAYDLFHCVTQSTASTLDYLMIVTGQKLASPTAATVTDFHARSRTTGTTLRWTTASETEILGFTIWRYRGAKGVKVNPTLIRAKRSGEPAGASYRFVDYVRGAKRGLTYRLQLVDLKGKRTWYTAFAIASK